MNQLIMLNSYRDDKYHYQHHKVLKQCELNSNFCRNAEIYCNFTQIYNNLLQEVYLILPKNSFYLSQLYLISKRGLKSEHDKNKRIFDQIKLKKNKQLYQMIILAINLLNSIMLPSQTQQQIKQDDFSIIVVKGYLNKFKYKLTLKLEKLTKILQQRVFRIPQKFYKIKEKIKTDIKQSFINKELNTIYQSLMNVDNPPPYVFHDIITKLIHRKYEYYDQLHEQLVIKNYLKKIRSGIVEKCGCQSQNCNSCNFLEILQFHMFNQNNPFNKPLLYNLRSNRASIAIHPYLQMQYTYNNYCHFRQSIIKQHCQRSREQPNLQIIPKIEKIPLFWKWNNQYVLIKNAVRGKNCNHIAYQQLQQLYNSRQTKQDQVWYTCKICLNKIKESDILYLSEVYQVYKRLLKLQKTFSKRQQYILDALLIINHPKKQVILNLKLKSGVMKSYDKSDIYNTLIDPLYIYNEYDIIVDSEEQEEKQHYNFPHFVYATNEPIASQQRRIFKNKVTFVLSDTNDEDKKLVSIINQKWDKKKFRNKQLIEINLADTMSILPEIFAEVDKKDLNSLKYQQEREQNTEVQEKNRGNNKLVNYQMEKFQVYKEQITEQFETKSEYQKIIEKQINQNYNDQFNQQIQLQ